MLIQCGPASIAKESPPVEQCTPIRHWLCPNGQYQDVISHATKCVPVGIQPAHYNHKILRQDPPTLETSGYTSSAFVWTSKTPFHRHQPTVDNECHENRALIGGLRSHNWLPIQEIRQWTSFCDFLPRQSRSIFAQLRSVCCIILNSYRECIVPTTLSHYSDCRQSPQCTVYLLQNH